MTFTSFAAVMFPTYVRSREKLDVDTVCTSTCVSAVCSLIAPELSCLSEPQPLNAARPSTHKIACSLFLYIVFISPNEKSPARVLRHLSYNCKPSVRHIRLCRRNSPPEKTIRQHVAQPPYSQDEIPLSRERRVGRIPTLGVLHPRVFFEGARLSGGRGPPDTPRGPRYGQGHTRGPLPEKTGTHGKPANRAPRETHKGRPGFVRRAWPHRARNPRAKRASQNPRADTQSPRRHSR